MGARSRVSARCYCFWTGVASLSRLRCLVNLPDHHPCSGLYSAAFYILHLCDARARSFSSYILRIHPAFLAFFRSDYYMAVWSFVS
jgi:hypothetical protein